MTAIPAAPVLEMKAPLDAVVPPAPSLKDKPPVRAKAVQATPPSLGRGGKQHKYLQNLIKEFGQTKGFLSVIEEPILDGAGRVAALRARSFVVGG